MRVLQEGEILPIGGTLPIKVDLRLLVATHRNLDELVAENQFRADLLARVSGFTLSLPPLRERREDLDSEVRRSASWLGAGWNVEVRAALKGQLRRAAEYKRKWS